MAWISEEENPNWRESLLEAAIDRIDQGLPLLYMNGEWNLLVGYVEGGTAFICKPYAGGQSGYEEMPKPGGFVGEGWFVSVLGENGRPADRRECIIWSLQKAVELAHMKDIKGEEKLCGFAAYENWIDGLERARDDVSLHGNAFCYSQLLTSREAASEYLRGIAGEFGAEVADHLRTAADGYARIASRLWEGRNCVKHPWEESWTPENRAKEGEVMRQNLADERAAISRLEAALHALGEGVPHPEGNS